MATKKNKIKFEDIEITVLHNKKMIDKFTNTLLAGKAISCTKKELDSRMNSCVAVLEGATEFSCLEGMWKLNSNRKSKFVTKKFNLVKVLKDFENGTFTLEETAEKINEHFTKSLEQAVYNERVSTAKILGIP